MTISQLVLNVHDAQANEILRVHDVTNLSGQDYMSFSVTPNIILLQGQRLHVIGTFSNNTSSNLVNAFAHIVQIPRGNWQRG